MWKNIWVKNGELLFLKVDIASQDLFLIVILKKMISTIDKKNILIKQTKRGFSLMELSIVLLIISFLVFAVMQGGEVVRRAKVTAAARITKSSVVSKIDNLMLWYETTMPNSIDNKESANNAAVNIWKDISDTKTTTNDANAPTSTQAPLYIASAINGLPVLRFDGTDDFMNLNGTFLVNTNYTIFVVEQRRNSKTNNWIMGGTGADAFKNFGLAYITDTSFICKHNEEEKATKVADDNITYTVSAYSAPKPIIHSITFNSNLGRVAYDNGVQKSSINSAAAKTPLSSNLGQTIGSYPVGTSYFNGDIAEIIMFTRTLSTQERKDVEEYLGKKWGIAIS